MEAWTKRLLLLCTTVQLLSAIATSASQDAHEPVKAFVPGKRDDSSANKAYLDWVVKEGGMVS